MTIELQIERLKNTTLINFLSFRSRNAIWSESDIFLWLDEFDQDWAALPSQNELSMIISDKSLENEAKRGKDEETIEIAKWKGRFGDWRRNVCPAFVHFPPILTRLMDLITGKLLTRPEWTGVGVMLCQVLCNAFTRYGRDRHLETWQLLCQLSPESSPTSLFPSLLLAPSHSPSLLSTALIFILNGISGDDIESFDSLDRIRILAQSPHIMDALTLRFFSNNETSIFALKNDILGNENSMEQELGHRILWLTVNAGYAKEWVDSAVKCSGHSSSTLIHLLSMIGDMICDPEVQNNLFLSPLCIKGIYRMIASLCANMTKLPNTPGPSSHLRNGRIEDDVQENLSFTSSIKTFREVIALIRDLSLHTGILLEADFGINANDDEEVIVHSILPIVHWLIHCLRQFHEDPTAGIGSSSSSPASSKQSSSNMSGWRGVKGDILLSLANMTWRSTRLQNAIQLGGGIPLILSCCKIDDDQPYIKECALFAIRNLCENNPGIQTILDGMERIKGTTSLNGMASGNDTSMQVHAELRNEMAQAGLQVEWDESTHRMRLKRDP